MDISQVEDKAELYELHDKVVIHEPDNTDEDMYHGVVGYITEIYNNHYTVVKGSTLQEALSHKFNDRWVGWYADHELLLVTKDEVQLEFNFGGAV